MILTCPSCQARFGASNIQFPPAGRRVRCSQCKHEWIAKQGSVVQEAEPVFEQPMPMAPKTQEPPVERMAEPAEMPEKEPVEVLDDDFMKRLDQVIAEEATTTRPPRPRISRRQTDVKPFNAKPFKIAAPTLAALWLVIAYYAYFPALAEAPLFGALYHAFGTTKTDGLAFQDVSMEREQDGGKARFIIAGSIENTSAQERMVPTVRVVLKNKDKESLWTREYPVKHALKAGEVYPFRITNVETAFASSVASIEVDLGNDMQLTLR